MLHRSVIWLWLSRRILECLVAKLWDHIAVLESVLGLALGSKFHWDSQSQIALMGMMALPAGETWLVDIPMLVLLVVGLPVLCLDVPNS